MEEQKKKMTLKERFKTLKAENWVLLVLEILILAVFLVADIWFFVDMANGVSFLGTQNHAYEIAVAIVILVLALIMISIIVYDIFFRDYVKEREGIEEKAVRNGTVVKVGSADPKEKENKAEK